MSDILGIGQVTDKLSQAITSTSQAAVGTLMVLGGVAGLTFRTRAGKVAAGAVKGAVKTKIPVPEAPKEETP